MNNLAESPCLAPTNGWQPEELPGELLEENLEAAKEGESLEVALNS